MDHRKLLRFSRAFFSLVLSSSEELPEDTKDLDKLLKNLESLETYQARRKYAEKNLEHLSSGSSRIVYLTPQKTVIKLAKNEKGIAQNRAEANSKIKSKFINKVLKKADNFSWIESEYLEKLTPKKFENLTGFDFEDFGDSLKAELKDEEKPDDFEKISKSELFKEILHVAKENDLLTGDLARISSWGFKDDHPVLIDSGLTKKIFEDFYES